MQASKHTNAYNEKSRHLLSFALPSTHRNSFGWMKPESSFLHVYISDLSENETDILVNTCFDRNDSKSTLFWYSAVILHHKIWAHAGPKFRTQTTANVAVAATFLCISPDDTIIASIYRLLLHTYAHSVINDRLLCISVVNIFTFCDIIVANSFDSYPEPCKSIVLKGKRSLTAG